MKDGRLEAINRRIWSGDTSAVAEMELFYAEKPEERLISLAVALYSFRHKGEFAVKLMALRPQLTDMLERWSAAWEGGVTPDVNEADVLTTHLLWIAENAQMLDAQRREIFELVLGSCQKALLMCCVPEDQQHTLCLIGITMAKASLLVGENSCVEVGLSYAFSRSDTIVDPKQKVRVYRGVGLVLRTQGKHQSARKWFLQALKVRKVPLAVHAKTVIAFLGIER